jgi:hypothetical protein
LDPEKPFADRRREAAAALLAGYAEMLALKLPEKAPELPVVDKIGGEEFGPNNDDGQARVRHAAQLQARRQAGFLRDLVQRRDTLAGQLKWLYRPDPKVHGRNPEGPEELRALARGVLRDPAAVDALLALVTAR